MVYGVVFVHVTWMVEVWSTFAASTPCVPKLSDDALLIAHAAIRAICALNVAVVVPAFATREIGNRYAKESGKRHAKTNARTSRAGECDI